MDGKYCTKCLEDKSINSYSKCSSAPDGLQYRCKECSKIGCLESRKKRLERDPEHDKQVKRTWYSRNRELSIERARKYRLEHPEWAQEMNTKHHKVYNWREKYPEKAKELGKRQAFKRKLKQYGLSPDEFQAMIDKQEGKCAVCGNIPPDGLVIDHNHTTHKVRELLCNVHNVAVGMIQENPDIARKIISYLEKHA